MNFDNDILTFKEKLIFNMRKLYMDADYCPWKSSRFEEYELYAANRAFLPSGDIITFTDSKGRLMALRPDVTLSIIKSIDDTQGDIRRFCYNENVYRTIDGELKEQMQAGLECIGDIDTDQTAEVLMLAKKSLDFFDKNSRIYISHMGFINVLLQVEGITDKYKTDIMHCIGEKNTHELQQILKSADCNDDFCKKLMTLTMLCGKLSDIETTLRKMSVNGYTDFVIDELCDISTTLKKTGINDGIYIDFSIINDITYYNDIIFQGFIEGAPEKVLSGGFYSDLLNSFNLSGEAVGFAINIDAACATRNLFNGNFEQLEQSEQQELQKMLNIALPKGRLGTSAYEILKKAGYECSEFDDNSRKLVFEDTQRGIRYFWVKPSDVAIYVERGVADIGVVGRDTLLENSYDVFQLQDLGIGKCRICVAGEKGFVYDNFERTLQVATKFPNIARHHFLKRGYDIDVIKLQGSIELAPILGLSDVIVDIVETGKTLEENNMKVVETITDISARLIANKTSYRFNREKIDNLCKAIEVKKNDKNN